MHMPLSASTFTSAVLLLGAQACSNGTAPQPLSSGMYAMQAYNGAALPYEFATSPPKGQNPGGCPILITAGRLSIHAVQGTFNYSYDIRNGCTQELMSQPGLQGSFEQHEGQLTFTVTRSDGITFHHQGSLTDSSLTFESDDEVLRFTRGQ